MLVKKIVSSIFFLFTIGLNIPILASPLEPDGIAASLSEKGFNYGFLKNSSN